MANSDQRVIKLTIECIDLPAHNWDGHSEIWLGIQSGKDVVQQVRLPAAKAEFHAELRVAGEDAPNFLGPFAHGTVQERFLYLCWGQPHFGHWAGFRRAKLPLTGLTWAALESNHLRAVVRCTDSKGGPICATVKPPFLSWTD